MVATAAEQPARALGQGVERGEEGLDAEHPAPSVRAEVAEEIVGDEGDDDAEHDVELEKDDEATGAVRRGDLGDEERGGDGGDTDANAAEKAREAERPEIPSQAAAKCRHERHAVLGRTEPPEDLDDLLRA